MTYSATTLAAAVAGCALLWSGATLGAPSGTDPADPAATGSQQQADDRSATAPGATRSQWGSAQTQQAAATSSGLQLVSAEDLVGRDLTTQDGQTVGTIKYVTVDVVNQGVSHLIVDTSNSSIAARGAGSGATSSGGAAGSRDQNIGQNSGTYPGADAGAQTGAQGGTDTAAATDPTEGGRTVIGSEPAPATGAAGQQTAGAGQQMASGGSMMVLPWTVVQSQNGRLSTVANAQQLAQAPRLKQQALNRLTEPALVAYVIDYWAPASELAAFEASQRRAQQPGTSAAGQDPASTPSPGGAAGDMERGTATQPDSGSGPLAGQSAGGPAATGQQPSTAQNRQPADRQGQQQSGEQQVMVLVGQGVATEVVPPLFQISEQLKGATVEGPDGQRLGEIRRIMIDQSSGHGAYALVEQREAGEPAAVPLKALRWGPDGTTTLGVSADQLQADAAFANDPRQVSRSDLAQLYQRFGVQPYWTGQGGQGQGQGQSRSGAGADPTSQP